MLNVSEEIVAATLVPAKKTKLSAAERKEQILRAASEVFSRYGFRGTTLRRLARRAGVSEAMIYQHFPSKEALYDAILEKKIEHCRHLYFPLEAARAKQDRSVLETIVGNFLQQQAQDNSFMRMILFSALEGHDLAHRFIRGPSQEFYHFLSSYLEERMQDGDLKCVDGQVAARLLIGTVFHFSLLREIFQDPEVQNVRVEDLTRLIVDLFYDGLKKPRGIPDSE